MSQPSGPRTLAARVAAEDRRIGELVRLQRRRRRLRQCDLAALVGISRQTVSLIERGRLEGLTVRLIRSVALAVGVELPFASWCDGVATDRTRDAGHARLVETLVRDLVGVGWQVHVEYSFNHYGDRGSVDILAWHEACEALLLVEVKTVLVDIQELLRALDVKERVVPGIARRENGWKARYVGVIVAVANTRTQRRIVERHAAVFEAALPARNVTIRRWVREPAGRLRGVWFVSSATVDSHETRSPKPRAA